MINTVIYSKPHYSGGSGGAYYVSSTKRGKKQYGDDDIVANSGEFKYLNAEEGYIEKLSGKVLDFEDIKLDGLVSDVVDTKKIIAEEAEIKKAIINDLTSTTITTEYLTVTKQAHFFELIIDKLKSVGGQIILTPTNCILDFAKAFDSNHNEIPISSLNSNNISNVSYFRVYWRANDPVSGKEISNDWVVWDQALCQSFNNVREGVNRNISNKYYWRLVTNVSQQKVLCDVAQQEVAAYQQSSAYDDYVEYGFETYNRSGNEYVLAEDLNSKLIVDMIQPLVGSDEDISIKAEKSNDESTTPFHVWTGHRTSNIGLQVSDSSKQLVYNDLYSKIDQSLSEEEIAKQIIKAREAANKVKSGIHADMLCVRIDKTTLGNTTEDIAKDINLAVIFDDGAYMIFPSGSAYEEEYDAEEDDIRLYFDISQANTSIYQILIYRNGHSNFVPCHWIDLSNVYIEDSHVEHRAATNSGCDYMVVPEASIPGDGDNLVQLGYRFNEAGKVLDEDGNPTDTWSVSRASAIMLCAYNSPDTGWHEGSVDLDRLEAPCYAQYQFIKDFNLGKYRGTYFDANGGMIAGDVTFAESVKDRLKDELDPLPSYRILPYQNQVFLQENSNNANVISDNKIRIMRSGTSIEDAITEVNQITGHNDKRLVLEIHATTETRNENDWCIFPFLTDDEEPENFDSERTYHNVAELFQNPINITTYLDNIINDALIATKGNTGRYGLQINKIGLYLKLVDKSMMWKYDYEPYRPDLVPTNNSDPNNVPTLHALKLLLNSAYHYYIPNNIDKYNESIIVDHCVIKVSRVDKHGLNLTGLAGDTYKFIYKAGATVEDISDDSYKGSIPRGWYTYPVHFNVGSEHLWMSQAIITMDGDTREEVWSNWSIPVMIDNGSKNKDFQMYWSYARITDKYTGPNSATGNYHFGIDKTSPWVHEDAWIQKYIQYYQLLSLAEEAGVSLDEYISTNNTIELLKYYANNNLLESSYGNAPFDSLLQNYEHSEYFHIYDSPLSVTDEFPIVYVYTRYVDYNQFNAYEKYHNKATTYGLILNDHTITSPHWTEFTCSVWSQKGNQGLDGNGIEYIYARNDYKDIPPVLETPSDWATNTQYQTDDYYPIDQGWSDEPFSTTPSNRYCWYATRKRIQQDTREYNSANELITENEVPKTLWQPWSTPAIWSMYALDGGEWLFIYRLWPLDSEYDPAQPIFANKTEIINDPDWQLESEFDFDYKTHAIWMSQALVDGRGNMGSFSTPIRITGNDGINGEDGTDIEFIYYLTDNDNVETARAALPASNIESDDILSENGPYIWTDHPQGVSETYMYELVSTRQSSGTESKNTKTWSAWSIPAIWSKWGERGMDGDGMEYIYYSSPAESTGAPLNPTPSDYASNNDYQNSNEYISHLTSLGWSDEPQDVTELRPIVWVSVRKRTNGVWGRFSDPVIWARYTAKGLDGSHPEFIYNKAPISNPPSKPAAGTTVAQIEAGNSGWTSALQVLSVLDKLNNNVIWMSQCMVSGSGVYGEWTDPITISGQDGKNGEDGSMVEFIYRAVSESGVNITEDPQTHIVTIEMNGQYADPNNINTSTNNTTVTDDDFVPTGWLDNPRGVNSEYPYEFVSQRMKKRDAQSGEYVWGQFSTPAIWSQKGIAGRDGDGMEYIYYPLGEGETPPSNPTPNDWETNTNYQNNDEYLQFLDTSKWFDEPRSVGSTFPVIYVCVRKRKNGVWGRFSDPAVWAEWTVKGLDGTSFRIFYIVANFRENEGYLEMIYPAGAQTITSSSTFERSFDWVPDGWTTTFPKLTADDIMNQYKRVFMTQCKIETTSTAYLFSGFNDPVAITGSQGLAGEDGTDIEFIYARSIGLNVTPTLSFVNDAQMQIDDYGVDQPTSLNQSQGDTLWSDNPRGITEELPIEWASVRYKKKGEWNNFTNPVVWSRWGENGLDGDGVQYFFLLACRKITPNAFHNDYILENWSYPIRHETDEDYIPYVGFIEETEVSNIPIEDLFKGDNERYYAVDNEGNYDPDYKTAMFWTDEPQEMDDKWRYQYVYIRKKVNGTWQSINSNNIMLWGEKQPDVTIEDIIYCQPTLDQVDLEYEETGYNVINGTQEYYTEKSVRLRYNTDITNPTNIVNPSTISVSTEGFNEDDYLPTGWSRTHDSVGSVHQFVFMSKRTKQKDEFGDISYSRFTEPILWIRYGEKGTNGEDGEGYKLIPKCEKATLSHQGVPEVNLSYSVGHFEKDGQMTYLNSSDIYSNGATYNTVEEAITPFLVVSFLFTADNSPAGMFLPYRLWMTCYASQLLDDSFAGFFSLETAIDTQIPYLTLTTSDYTNKHIFNMSIANLGNDGIYWELASDVNNLWALPQRIETRLYRVDEGFGTGDMTYLLNYANDWAKGDKITGLTILDSRTVLFEATSGCTWKKTDEKIETTITAYKEEIVDATYKKVQTNWYELEQTAEQLQETLGQVQNLLDEDGEMLNTVINLNNRLETAEESLHTLQQFNYDYTTGLEEMIETKVRQTASDWSVTALKNGMVNAGILVDGTNSEIDLTANNIVVTGPEQSKNGVIKVKDYAGNDGVIIEAGENGFAGASFIQVNSGMSQSGIPFYKTIIAGNSIKFGESSGNGGIIGWDSSGGTSTAILPRIEIGAKKPDEDTGAKIILTFENLSDPTPVIVFVKGNSYKYIRMDTSSSSGPIHWNS